LQTLRAGAKLSSEGQALDEIMIEILYELFFGLIPDSSKGKLLLIALIIALVGGAFALAAWGALPLSWVTGRRGGYRPLSTDCGH
jgi:hypothetical protein